MLPIMFQGTSREKAAFRILLCYGGLTEVDKVGAYFAPHYASILNSGRLDISMSALATILYQNSRTFPANPLRCQDWWIYAYPPRAKAYVVKKKHSSGLVLR